MRKSFAEGTDPDRPALFKARYIFVSTLFIFISLRRPHGALFIERVDE